MIIRAHPEELKGSLNFISRYPILSDLDLKMHLFKLEFPINLPYSMPQRVMQFDFARFGRLNITIDRTDLLNSTLNEINRYTSRQFLNGFSISFIGERGQDEGGVSRDFFESISDVLFSHQYNSNNAISENSISNNTISNNSISNNSISNNTISNNTISESSNEKTQKEGKVSDEEIFDNWQYANIFIPTPSGKGIYIDPHSDKSPRGLKICELAGKMMALALLNSKLLNAHLTSSLYKAIIGQPLTLRDLEAINEPVANSLRAVLSTDNAEDFGLVFSVGDIELIKNGLNIEVNDSNKEKFVQLAIDFYLKRGVELQIEHFVNGFLYLIPREKLQMFTPDELDLIICGVPDIDIQDLKKSTVFVSPYSDKHPVIILFFKVIREWKKEDLARLLRFVTGTSQVPVGGFRTFQQQGIPFRIAPGGDRNRLPQGHTCYNQLDLPMYQNEKEMNEKMLFAIRNTTGFGLI